MTFDFRYPQLTGATEKEQIQQMRAYIHQLVDELKWALNSVDSSQGNCHVSSRINNSGSGTAVIDSNDYSAQRDLVIETGEKNGWSYKKWKSGTFEMFGQFTVTATIAGTAYGNLYYSEQFVIPAPFACSCAVVVGNATSWFIPITGGLANNDDPNNNIGIRLFRPNNFEIGQDLSVSLYVVGKHI